MRMMELKDEGEESGKLGKPRKPRRGVRGRAEGPQGSVRNPKPGKVEELGQGKQEREGKQKELLPASLQNKIIVSLIISEVGWWGGLLLLVLYITNR